MTPPDWISPESWAAFAEMRRKIRAPLTPYAEKLILARLAKMKAAGYDPQYCLDLSIENAWRSIYPRRAEVISAVDGAELARIKEQEARATNPPAVVLELAERMRAKIGLLKNRRGGV